MKYFLIVLLLVLTPSFVLCGNLTFHPIITHPYGLSSLLLDNRHFEMPLVDTVKNPLISSFYPGPLDFTIPDSLSIKMSFVKQLDQSTISDSSLVVYSSFYGRIKGTISYIASQQLLVFTPAKYFHPNDLISVSLTPGIKTVQNDTIEACEWSFTISPLSGTGAFTMTTPVTLMDVAGTPVQADLNNDGLVDIVYRSYPSFGITIMKNLGNLKFSTKTFSFPKEVTELTTGDLDGDGRMDIIAKTGMSLIILKQMPDGEFMSAAELNYTTTLSGGLIVADIDADGRQDISICAYFGTTVAMKMLFYRNNGNMQFRLVKEMTFNYPVNMIRYSDLDGNGYPDMVIASYYGMAVLVLKNSGNFNFSGPDFYRQGIYNANVQCADFDNDGYIDIACSGSSSNSLSILKNDGTGKFTASSVKVSASNIASFTLGDFDKNTYPDIIVSTYENYLLILKNNGNMSFTENKIRVSGNTSDSGNASDFDNDGDIDILFHVGNPRNLVMARNKNITPEIRLLGNSYDFGILKAGQVKSTTFSIVNEGASEPLLISDIVSSNMDFTVSPSKGSIVAGDTMKVTISLKQTGAVSYCDSITVFSNDKRLPEMKFFVSGRGAQVLSCYPPPYSFSAPETASIRIEFSVLLEPSTISDSTVIIVGSHSGKHKLKTIAFDQHEKILILETQKPFAPGENVNVSLTSKIHTQTLNLPFLPRIWSFNVLSKASSMIFKEQTSMQLPSYTFKPLLRDMDNDGLQDIVILTQTGPQLRIYKNDGSFKFIMAKSISFSQWPEDFVVADLDNDGDIDIAICTTDSKILLLRNEGNLNFTNSILTVEGYFTKITAGDYNNDGLTDLAVSTGASCYLKNLGNFTFEASVIAGSKGKVAASQDFDDDGDIDLAMQVYETKIMRNDGNSFTWIDSWLFGNMPVSWGDYNQDGLLDFSGNYFMGSSGYTIAINKGDLSFQETMIPVKNDWLKDMVSSDFNGDSTAEFIALSDNALQIDQLDRNLKLIKQSIMPLKNQSNKIVSDDLNNDGTADLVIFTSGSSSSLSIYENRKNFKEISLNMEIYNFDSVTKDSSKTAFVKISNKGSESLHVDSVYSSSPAFSVFPVSFTVAPLDSQTVTVTFIPKDVKTYSDSVTFLSNDPEHPAVKLYLTGSYKQVLVDSVYPRQHAPSANPSIISLRLKEDIVPESVSPSTITVYGTRSGYHPYTFSYDPGNKLLTFFPEGKFIDGEKIDITIRHDFRLRSGDPVLFPFSWSFYVKVHEGSATFRKMADIKTGKSSDYFCAADLNNDGIEDIVTSDYNSDRITVIRGSQDGKMSFVTSVAVIDLPHSITAGDLNGDGKIDLAVACDFGISIIKNEGDFQFLAVSWKTIQRGNHLIEASDLDGDGDLDLVTTNHTLNNFTILRNDGNMSFISIPLPFNIERPKKIITGDIDNDGDFDIILGTAGFPQFVVLKNLGNLSFSIQYPEIRNTDYMRDIAAADFNNDGKLDVAANSNYFSLVLHKNLGDMNFLSLDQGHSASPYSLAGADYDADGDIDLVSIDGDYADKISLHKNENATFKYNPLFARQSGVVKVISGDFNGDGTVDFAFVDIGANTVGWYMNIRMKDYSLSTNDVKFPDLQPGKDASQKFTLRNIGVEELKIDSFYVKNKVFSAQANKLTIAKFDSAVVMVNFKPDTLGSYNDTLYIISKADSYNKIVLQGICTNQTGHSDLKTALPDKFELFQNYPNPFNPSTSIHFALQIASRVKIEIVNALGQKVFSLADGEFEAGWHEIKWTPAVSSGIYFYYIEAETADGKRYKDSKKMIYLK